MKRPRLSLALVPALPLLFFVACGDDETSSGGGLPDAGPAVPSGSDSSTGFDAAADAPGLDAAAPDAAKPDASDAAPCPIGFDETVTAEMKVTADDYLRLWVNGVLVDD